MKQHLTYPSLTDLDEAILDVISENQPIKAIHIANILSVNQETHYRRTDINRRLYGILRGDVVQDEYFQWSLWEEVEPPPTDNPEDINTADEEGTINTDSAVKLRYSGNKVLLIKFTRVKTSASKTPQLDDFTYVYFQSPLGLSILGKRVGDICTPIGVSYEILEID